MMPFFFYQTSTIFSLKSNHTSSRTWKILLVLVKKHIEVQILGFPVDNKTVVSWSSTSGYSHYDIWKYVINKDLLQSPGGVTAVQEQQPRQGDFRLCSCGVQSWDTAYSIHSQARRLFGRNRMAVHQIAVSLHFFCLHDNQSSVCQLVSGRVNGHTQVFP